MQLKRSAILLLIIFFSSACLLVYSSHKTQIRGSIPEKECPVKCCGTYQQPAAGQVPAARMIPRIIFPFNS